MSGSELTRHKMTSTRVPLPMTYDLLQPCGLVPGAPMSVVMPRSTRSFWLDGWLGRDR